MAYHAGKLMHKLDKMIHKMSRKDVAILKIDIIFGVLLIVHFVPELAQIHWAWSLAVIILCEFYLYSKLEGRKLFKIKKDKSDKTDD